LCLHISAVVAQQEVLHRFLWYQCRVGLVQQLNGNRSFPPQKASEARGTPENFAKRKEEEKTSEDPGGNVERKY
jgi:hypothetical protein